MSGSGLQKQTETQKQEPNAGFSNTMLSVLLRQKGYLLRNTGVTAELKDY